VRARTTAAIVLACMLTACSRAAVVPQAAPAALQVRPLHEPSSPSPLVEVRVGSVRGVVPEGWDARLLPADHVAQEGFEASPRIQDWERGVPAIPGIEAFWIDVGKLGIPSDYYYLAARSVSFDRMGSDGDACGSSRPNVLANHPPDLTGRHDSPSDFVAYARGTCTGGDGRPTRWGYVVAAPGFGPIRSVGIPTSGLYVVMAQVSGPHSATLLHEMLSQASFGQTTIPQLVRAAVREQHH
jgi:hypothetical protein